MIRITYKEVEGYMTETPSMLDTESSVDVVYLRKNITEVNNEEGDGTHWKYDEAILTVAEYQDYLAELENPSTELIMQQLSDVQLEQVVQSLTTSETTELIMQSLSDIQADIMMI